MQTHLVSPSLYKSETVGKAPVRNWLDPWEVVSKNFDVQCFVPMRFRGVNTVQAGLVMVWRQVPLQLRTLTLSSATSLLHGTGVSIWEVINRACKLTQPSLVRRIEPLSTAKPARLLRTVDVWRTANRRRSCDAHLATSVEYTLISEQPLWPKTPIAA